MTTERIPPNRFWLFGLVAATGTAADLYSKHIMFHWSALDQGIYWLWPGHVGLQRALNEGALFGMGQGMVTLFALISLVALVAIPVWLFGYGAARDRLTCIALAAITAGVLGNLYDRVGLPRLDWAVLDSARAGMPVYAVRDWILLQVNDEWRWPNFNVADALLVCGAAIAAFRSFVEKDVAPN